MTFLSEQEQARAKKELTEMLASHLTKREYQTSTAAAAAAAADDDDNGKEDDSGIEKKGSSYASFLSMRLPHPDEKHKGKEVEGTTAEAENDRGKGKGKGKVAESEEVYMQTETVQATYGNPHMPQSMIAKAREALAWYQESATLVAKARKCYGMHDAFDMAITDHSNEDGFCLLNWWKGQTQGNRALALIAAPYVGGFCSNALTEGFFSIAGACDLDNASNMKPETLSKRTNVSVNRSWWDPIEVTWDMAALNRRGTKRKRELNFDSGTAGYSTGSTGSSSSSSSGWIA